MSHPASRMWKGYEHALARYSIVGLIELLRRDRYYPHHFDTFRRFLEVFPDTGNPPWLGREDFHASHRAALLYKDPVWYGQFGWKESPAVPDSQGRLGYVWPV